MVVQPRRASAAAFDSVLVVPITVAPASCLHPMAATDRNEIATIATRPTGPSQRLRPGTRLRRRGEAAGHAGVGSGVLFGGSKKPLNVAR